jgi:hypothetical protein
MKKIFIITLFLGIVNVAFTQLEVPSKEILDAFFKSKTCLVLDENPFSETNIQLKSAVEKLWKLTPFEIISTDEYEKRRKSSAYSFVSIDQVYYEHDKTDTKYMFLCVSLGGNYKTESDMPQLCTVPLAYADADESSYAYKIGTLLIFVQNHIQTIQKNPSLKKSSIIDYYNNNKGNLQQKTLYLLKEEVEKSVQTDAALKKIYPYPFKFVSQDDIEQAIDSKNPNVVFLHKVGPTKKKGYRCYVILLGTVDAMLYFYDYHMVDDNSPNALLGKEIKKMITK